MNVSLPPDDQPTQCQHPVRTVTRSSLAASAAAIPLLWPILAPALGAKGAAITLTVLIAGNAVFTRIMACETVEAILRQVLGGILAAKPDEHHPPRNVHLSAADATALTFDPQHTGVKASEKTRTVTALVIPWGQDGYTDLGILNVAQGGVRLPRDLARCKLYSEHTGHPDHKVVGFALSASVDHAGLHMTFQIGRTPDGDAAILDIRERLRDAVSAELAGIKRQGKSVTDSIMTGVALVPTPAFRDARVTALHAQHNPEGTTTVNVRDYIQALMAAGATEAEARASAAVRFGQDAVDAVTDIDFTPVTPTEETPPAATDTAAPATDAAPVTAAASYTPPRPAVVPTGITTAPRGGVELSLSQAIRTLHAIQTRRGEGVAHAALANITRAGTVDAEVPQWLGELWSGVAYSREFIPLMNRRDLTSYQIKGFRWLDKPLVAAYAGNKAEIPTNPVSLEPFTEEAVRWAGGHDLDRKFYDFGEYQILDAYWRAMNESYSIVTDTAAETWTVANAKVIADVNATDILRAILATKTYIRKTLHVDTNYWIANTADMYTLLDYTDDTVPKFLDLFDIDPSRIKWRDSVPSGTLLAGAKPAATFYELPKSPLRVEAEHLTHGGRDAALFGYTAFTLDNEDGLVKIDYTP